MIAAERQEAKDRCCKCTLIKSVLFTDLYSLYGKASMTHVQPRQIIILNPKLLPDLFICLLSGPCSKV